eukprot:2469433-Rhodomonas_salina.3
MSWPVWFERAVARRWRCLIRGDRHLVDSPEEVQPREIGHHTDDVSRGRGNGHVVDAVPLRLRAVASRVYPPLVYSGGGRRAAFQSRACAEAKPHRSV